MAQEEYVHKPLSDNTKQIRLLQVRPSLAFDEPRCSIESFYLTDLPPYVALSYRWGDVNDKVDLRIRGALFPIPFTAWSALQYMELPATIYIWIDAVCIDQTNILERNAQVVLMSTIYSRASEVYVWLGLGDSQTAIAFNVLSKNLSVLLRPEEIQAVTKLLDNEYWGRTWIIQEIMFAERIILTCGQHRVSWDALNIFLTVTAPRHWTSMSGNPYTMSKFDITLAARLVKSRNDFTNQTRSLKVHNNRELYNFLDGHRYSKCSDARDKVFALLGIFNTMAKIPLEVDYFRTKEEVLLISLA